MKTLKEIRNDFPILSREVNGKPLVYLDNGATTQKPQIVIEIPIVHGDLFFLQQIINHKS